MAHTTCGSEKTDGGKHPRARSGGERGQGQSLWIDLCFFFCWEKTFFFPERGGVK